MPRFRVEQAVDMLERLERRHLAVEEALCTRKRHRLSSCTRCSDACPTGALTRVDDGGRTGLSFSVAACTNCGLCRDICIFDAVRLDPQVNLGEVVALSVEWQFVQHAGGAPWDDPPDGRIGRQILKSVVNATE